MAWIYHVCLVSVHLLELLANGHQKALINIGRSREDCIIYMCKLVSPPFSNNAKTAVLGHNLKMKACKILNNFLATIFSKSDGFMFSGVISFSFYVSKYTGHKFQLKEKLFHKLPCIKKTNRKLKKKLKYKKIFKMKNKSKKQKIFKRKKFRKQKKLKMKNAKRQTIKIRTN